MTKEKQQEVALMVEWFTWLTLKHHILYPHGFESLEKTGFSACEWVGGLLRVLGFAGLWDWLGWKMSEVVLKDWKTSEQWKEEKEKNRQSSQVFCC